MKSLAILVVLALELAVCGCGNNVPNTVTQTQTSGNWEAQLIDGTGQTTLLNFIVAFNVTNNGPLDITGFAFFNQGACFATGLNQEGYSGTASFTTNNAGQVNGTLSMTITSNTTGSVLTLQTGQLTGTSNGTTTTTGTLSNGVVVGQWSLAPGTNANGCTGATTGTYIMCQGKNTCTT